MVIGQSLGITVVVAMAQSNLPNLKPGDLIAGQFRIVEMIGSGGFSVVYRAHQESMNRFVAIKVLKPRAAGDPRVVERFRREALYASHLNHPNTITLFDYGQTDGGLFYIAMEYLVGMDLSVVVSRGEPVELRRVWRLVVQCCRSLAEAHRIGLVHRDLKPENIFLVQREEGSEFVKVLDFGVSKALNTFGNQGPATMAPLTQEGTVFGTPLYMAPEQAMAEQISPAVDVYALGHIIFEMITGRAAYWDCTNPMDVMLRQVNDPPLALPKPWNQTPFSRLITKCTQKNPKKRISDAGKLLEQLMDPAFAQYMDPTERPLNQRSIPNISTLRPRQETSEQHLEVEEVYRWEFEVLEDAFRQVQNTREPRVVVIRGKPGTGRSNLLRAFLRKVKKQGGVNVIHRQTAGAHIPPDAGLEADLAIAAGVDMQQRGFSEVKRIVFDLYKEDQDMPKVDAIDELDSGPLSTLLSMRDTFLSRMSTPFRERAEKSLLVWGVENLERADTLTVSFLDRFLRDLQSHPSPILIVVTVSPEEIELRPGLVRYTERILSANKPFGRQVSLVPPGERKIAGPPEDLMPQPTRKSAEELAVGGSYFGDKDIDLKSSAPEIIAQPKSPITVPIAIESTTFAAELGDEPSENVHKPTGDETFDRVVGYLAMLGDEIPHGLWRVVCEKLFDERMRRFIPMIMEQAERFGILHQTSRFIYFAKHGYMEAMRQEFELREDAIKLHRTFAKILQSYYETPNREQLKNIVYHMVRCEQQASAIYLLQTAGQSAFRALDFDAAREYYLQIQQLIDFLSPDLKADLDGDGVADSLELERPRLWLRLGEIHGALHEHGAAEDALRRALGEALPDDYQVHGRANKLLGDLSASQGRFGTAMRFYEQAQQFFRLANMAKAFVAVTGELGHCALMQGQPEQAQTLLTQALDHAVRLRDEYLIARLHRYMGQALTNRSEFLKALEHLEESMKRFERYGREIEVIMCLEELGNAAFASSQYELSLSYFTRAVAHSTASHVSMSRSPHLGLARALAALDNLPQAQVHLVEALTQAETAHQPFNRAEVLLHLGDLFLAEEDFEGAASYYEQVVDVAKTIGHTRLWLDALIRKAYLAFDQLDSERCYSLLTQAAEMAQAIGDRDAELQVRTHIIYFQLLEHDLATQGDTFSSLIGMGKKMRLGRTPVLCWLFRADVSAARQDYTTARDELRQAYMHASQLGDYALFILIARRDYALQKAQAQLADVTIGQGYALGALIPPEIRRRRFDGPAGSASASP